MIGINRLVIEHFIDDYQDLLVKTEEMLLLLRKAQSDEHS
jgi:hypothetical protein